MSLRLLRCLVDGSDADSPGQITIIHTCLDGFARLRELTSMDAMLHLNEEYVSQAMGIIEVQSSHPEYSRADFYHWSPFPPRRAHPGPGPRYTKHYS